MEQEFIQNQERLKPQEEKNQVREERETEREIEHNYFLLLFFRKKDLKLMIFVVVQWQLVH